MAKGDILLISFPFTDLTGTKLRPAVVFTENLNDVTVAFITTQTQWRVPTDVLLLPNLITGIKKQSMIRTNKIATLDRSLAQGLLGRLSTTEMVDLNAKLRTLFQLN